MDAKKNINEHSNSDDLRYHFAWQLDSILFQMKINQFNRKRLAFSLNFTFFMDMLLEPCRKKIQAPFYREIIVSKSFAFEYTSQNIN